MMIGGNELRDTCSNSNTFSAVLTLYQTRRANTWRKGWTIHRSQNISGYCTVGAWLPAVIKIKQHAPLGQYLDGWTFGQHWLVATSERRRPFFWHRLGVCTWVYTVHTPANRKEFRAVYAGTHFLQFPRALGECGTTASLEVRLYGKTTFIQCIFFAFQ